MRLARQFCEAGGGVIAVMHDLNLTALFADQIVLMKYGRLAAAGSVRDVLTDEMMQSVFGCPVTARLSCWPTALSDPRSGTFGDVSRSPFR